MMNFNNHSTPWSFEIPGHAFDAMMSLSIDAEFITFLRDRMKDGVLYISSQAELEQLQNLLQESMEQVPEILSHWLEGLLDAISEALSNA